MNHLHLLARGLIAVSGAALLVLAHPPAAAAPPLMQIIHDYPLPGNATRWDYMSMNAASSQLILAHLGDGTVVVVDTHTKALTGVVGHVPQVHGVLAVPESGRIYATATATNELVVIDAAGLSILARVSVGRYPDGLAYAPAAHKIYVSDKTGATASVVDTRTNRRIATIALGGTVGNPAYDPVSGHVFINAEGKGELVEVDPANDTVVARTPLPGAEGNHGLLIEPALRLAFIACEGNDKLLVLNLVDRRVIAEFKVDGEPDVLAYDKGLGILYVATEAGPLHLFRVGPGGVARLGRVDAGRNAHTVAVDPASHEVYLPLNQAGARPVLRVMRPAP